LLASKGWVPPAIKLTVAVTIPGEDDE